MYILYIYIKLYDKENDYVNYVSPSFGEYTYLKVIFVINFFRAYFYVLRKIKIKEKIF